MLLYVVYFLIIFLSDLWFNLFLVISLKPYKHKSLGEIFWKQTIPAPEVMLK